MLLALRYLTGYALACAFIAAAGGLFRWLVVSYMSGGFSAWAAVLIGLACILGACFLGFVGAFLCAAFSVRLKPLGGIYIAAGLAGIAYPWFFEPYTLSTVIVRLIWSHMVLGGWVWVVAAVLMPGAAPGKASSGTIPAR